MKKTKPTHRKPRRGLRKAIQSRKSQSSQTDGQRLGVAPTLASAIARTKLPAQVVQSVKASGSLAFNSNNSVDCDLLLEDVAKIKIDDAQPDYYLERALDLRANRKLKEQKLRERDKLVWPIEKIKSAWTRNVIACKTKLATSENAVAVEAGMRLGFTAEQIAILKEIHTKHNRAAMKELFAGEFGKCECPNCKKEIKE